MNLSTFCDSESAGTYFIISFKRLRAVFGRLIGPVPSFGSVLMSFFLPVSIMKSGLPRYSTRFTNEVQVSPTCNGEAMIQVPRKEWGMFRNEPCFVFGCCCPMSH